MGPDTSADSFGTGQHAGAIVFEALAHLDALDGHGVRRWQGDTGGFGRAVVEEAHCEVGDLHQVPGGQRGFVDQLVR